MRSSSHDSCCPPPPEQVNRNSGRQQQPPNKAFFGVTVDRAGHDEGAGCYEEGRGPRMAWNQISDFLIWWLASAKYEESRRRESKENEIRRDYVVQNLFIAPR